MIQCRNYATLQSPSMSSLTSKLSDTLLTRYKKPCPNNKSLGGGLAARGPQFERDPECSEQNLCSVIGHGLQPRTVVTPRVSFSTRPYTAPQGHHTSTYNPSDPRRIRRRDKLKKDLKHNLPEREPGVLPIRLEVDHIDVERSSGQSWLRTYQQTVLRAYTLVLRDETTLLQRLNSKRTEHHLDRITFTKISLEKSLRINAKIAHLEGLDQIHESLGNGTLMSLVNDVIVTEAFLRELGVRELAFDASVARGDVVNCRLEVERATCNVASGTDKSDCVDEIAIVMESNKPSNSDYEGDVPTKTITCEPDDDTWITDIYVSWMTEVNCVKQRYEILMENSEDFFMTLKLVKPLDMERFCCLADVIKCYKYLQERNVIKQNVRSDLVKEFLTIVNLLRVKVKDTLRELLVLEHDHKRYKYLDSLRTTIQQCQDLDNYFDPSFQFCHQENETGDKMNVMNRKLFGLMAGYVPTLITMMENSSIIPTDYIDITK